MNYLLGLTITGLISGVTAGLLGAGAEILVVPLLSLLGLLGTLKNRIGTSLFMLLPPIGLFAAIEFYKDGYVDIFAALYMAVIFTIFSYFSSRYIKKVDTILLRKVFGIFTVISGVYLFYTKHD